jgi:hypothetical protein
MDVIVKWSNGESLSIPDSEIEAITFKPHTGQDEFEAVTVCPARTGVKVEVSEGARILSEAMAANQTSITGEPAY